MGLRRRAESNGAVDGSPGADIARAARRVRKPLTASRAKRIIGVGTAVAPLVAPYVMAAAGATRARWDSYRATRLGVSADQLSAFAGRGGALHARLSRVAESLVALDGGEPGRAGGTGAGPGANATPAARRFAADVRPRLADLAVAVRAAEQMPAPRRRTAFRAISAELDRTEAELLTHLGVDT